MTIDYHRVKNWPFPDVVQRYSTLEPMLYALSLGLGCGFPHPRALDFVYEGKEDRPLILPTLPVVLGFPGFWMKDSATGIDWARIVHGEQGLVLHHPLPPGGEVVGRSRVTSIVDKGAGKGAVVTTERTVSDAVGGRLYATIRQVSFCRGDGGYSSGGMPSDTSDVALSPTPETPPAKIFDQPTRADTALLYRLLADRNPLHADPAAASAAGFSHPVLHGLATFGLAAVAVLREYADMDPRRLKSIDARFSAPIYPGETLRTEMWRAGEAVQFRCRVIERNIVVLSHGRSVVSEEPV